MKVKDLKGIKRVLTTTAIFLAVIFISLMPTAVLWFILKPATFWQRLVTLLISSPLDVIALSVLAAFIIMD